VVKSVVNILALDLATKTGWASKYNNYFCSGVQDFSLRRGESPGMKFLRFRRWLEELTAISSYDVIIYEQAISGRTANANVAQTAFGFAAIVQEICAQNAIEHTTVHASTLKKHATGKGNAKKDAMIIAAKEKWPDIQIIDDNHADALHILDYALKTLGDAND